MGTLWGRSSSLEWDNNGVLAEGALAYFYEAGTSTPKAVYSDGAESTAHEFPLEADGGRWPAVFIPFGSYKVVIKTAGGTPLFTADEVPNPEPFDETFSLDEDAILNTGDVWFSLKNGTRSGAVRLNGRTIGDASSSATERANADCADLFAFLWNNIADARAAVSGGRGATAAADFAAHKTITLPSARGANPLGFDDMGNSAASLLGSAPVVSGSAILSGSILGENTHTITEAQLPGHTHGFGTLATGAGSAHTHGTGTLAIVSDGAHSHTGATGGQSVTHTHTQDHTALGITYQIGATNLTVMVQSGSLNTGNASVDHTHTISSHDGHTHSFSGSLATESSHTHSVTSGATGSTGSGTAHNIVARALMVTWYIKL